MTEKRMTPVAPKLRREVTDAEALLWSRLRSQQLDVGQHAAATTADAARTRMIEAHGYRVVRFWNNDVMENLDGVFEEILRALRIASNR